MTVVLAVRCSDGLVLAADSQATESDRGVSYPVRKLHPLGDSGAWGGSGSRSVLIYLQDRFDEASGSILEAEDAGRAIQDRALPVYRYHYDRYIETVPGEGDGTSSPAAYVLATGYTDDQPWIVEIDPHGQLNRYQDIGFHAIGSGAPMAQQAGALLAHFRMTTRSIDYGVVAAVRVLDALEQTSPSVGGPMDVWRITAHGSSRWTTSRSTRHANTRSVGASSSSPRSTICSTRTDVGPARAGHGRTSRPSTRRGMPSGLSSRSARGSRLSGTS